jgi:MFS family permease
MFRRFALYGFLKNLRLYEPFLILALREGGLSYTQIGLLYSVRALLTNLLEIPSGLLADAWGRRTALLIAFASYIAAFVLFYVADSFATYAVAMACFGIGEAFRSGTHKALILAYLTGEGRENERIAYYGSTRAASQMGSAINSLIAAALVIYAGSYQFLFLAAVLPYVLGMANVATYPRALDVPVQGATYRSAFRGFSRILKRPGAIRAMINAASFTSCFKASKDYIQPLVATAAVAIPLSFGLGETGRSAVLVGLVYFVIFLVAGASSRSAKRVSERFRGLYRAVNATYLLGAVVFLLAGLGTYRAAAAVPIVLFVVVYMLQNLRKPMTVAFTTQQIPDEVMASGLSAESQMTTLLEMLLAPLIGLLADRVGLGGGLVGAGVFLLAMYPFARVASTRVAKTPA